ncbi:heme biosynthesis HemY N-terminal domain-containing protein [Aliidiomarina indica]|uniref:heme biosynthesis HemY N-terminal domain-containing protein n=1 Tax=Aliidiomarina indica TaxID=2749147 RepID=UPI00188F0902
MLKALLLILILALGLIVGPMWSGNPGSVLILAGPYSIEMSLVVATLIVVAALLLLWTLQAIFRKLSSGKQVTLGWFYKRKQRKAEEQMAQAMHHWLAKNYREAATQAERAAPSLKQPQHGYLLAASAWQALGNQNELKRVLGLAYDVANDDLNVRLLQLEQMTDSTLALKTARQLLQDHPKHGGVLRATAEAYYKHQHFESLRQLLPQIQDRDIVPGARLAEFTRASYRALYQSAGSASERLLSFWKDTPKKLRRAPAVRMAYLDVLTQRGLGAIASKVATRGLELNVFTASDLLQFEMREWRQTEALREQVEKQIKRHPDHPNWFVLLGVLAMQESDYGLAERALQKAISMKPSQLAYRLLGDAYIAGGQKETALQAYRQAANLR